MKIYITKVWAVLLAALCLASYATAERGVLLYGDGQATIEASDSETEDELMTAAEEILGDDVDVTEYDDPYEYYEQYKNNTQDEEIVYLEQFLDELTTPTPPPVEAVSLFVPTRTLKYGSDGDDVVLLQQKLTQLGFYNGNITGEYFAKTRDAVNAYQKANGLKVTGAASVELQMMIYEFAAALPTPTPAPVYDTSSAPPFVTTLRQGIDSDGVLLAQERLKALGYYDTVVTGSFGSVTKNAVIAFQNNNGLDADGIIGSATWHKLFADSAVRDAAALPTPKPTAAPSQYYVTVDVTNQIVTVYSRGTDGSYSNVVRKMICSTGTTSNPSPLGTYTLNGKTARWCYFSEWDSHAQYWTRINSSIAFHSVIYTNPNEMDLSTASYYSLGKRASHGCIRLLVADAKWIYTNCKQGTVVDIFEGKLDPEATKALLPPELDKSVMLPVPTPMPTPTPVYNADRVPLPFRVLEIGTQGEDVWYLQKRLKDLGYYNGSVTGGYHEGTRDAVRLFQKDNKLTADGVAGPITLGAIYRDLLTTPTPEGWER